LKKFIPLCTPYLDGKEKEYLNDCIESTYVSTAGKYIELFEQNLKSITNSPFAIALNSGTSALHLSLLAAGVKKNELVITTDYSFIATANSITYCGAEPALIDVNYDSFNIDFDLIEKFLQDSCSLKNDDYFHNETGKRISAIVPVLALGNIICPTKLRDFKTKFNIPIILDAAAAIGGRASSLEIGDFEFDFATFSFNGNKIITCGAGGAILCKKTTDHEKIRHLAATSRMHPTYFHDEIGYNYRMANINAAIGFSQLEKIEQLLCKKHEIYNFYRNNLQSKNIIFYSEPPELISSKWISGFMIENKSEEVILEFQKHMAKNNIGASSFWIPVSKQNAFLNCVRLLNGNSESISKKFIALPSSINIEKKELMYIVNKINNFFKEK